MLFCTAEGGSNGHEINYSGARKLLENAKRYANAHDTTLTQLITAYLERIPIETESLDNAPVVRRLTGLLSADVSMEDYKKHLQEKYGRS